MIVSSPPTLHNGETAHCLMFDVYIAAVPAIIAGILFFGLHALWILLVSIISAVITELVIQMFFTAKGFTFRPLIYNILTNDDITILDGSALATGILLAFTLPPGAPLWIPAVGSVFAIAVGKHVFGGLGNNIFNPALVGRAFLLAAWPGIMTTWTAPLAWLAGGSGTTVDAVTAATPLTAMKMSNQTTPLLDMILGNTSGCMGETSAIALLLGAGYLLYKGTITWHIPFSYIGTVFIFALLLGQDPVFHLFAGGLMLGAFYMATDVVTSPVTRSGRIIFGCGAGMLTILIRKYGGYPEGVCYAILIMNALAPLIERITMRSHQPDEVTVPMLDKILKD